MWVCWSCRNKRHRRVAQTTETHCPAALEARSLRWRGGLVWFPLRPGRRTCFSPPASRGWVAVFGGPWPIDTSPWSLPSSPHDIISVCASVSQLPHLIRTQSSWTKVHPDDFIIIEIPLQRPYFQVTPLSEILGVRISKCEFGGT